MWGLHRIAMFGNGDDKATDYTTSAGKWKWVQMVLLLGIILVILVLSPNGYLSHKLPS